MTDTRHVEDQPEEPPSVRWVTGPGGMPVVDAAAGGGSARIHYQGAQVMSWQPAGTGPVLWASRASSYRAGTPMRGGVPVCLPWFGPRADGGGPAHGFARTRDWLLTGAGAADDAVNLAFQLEEDGTSDPDVWPHPLLVRLGLSVGSRLGLALEVTNTGPRPFRLEAALHTYLAVGDVRQVRVRGLERCSYLDRLTGTRVPASGAELTITGETDRVYDRAGTVQVVDPVAGRTLVVESTHATHVVVWNPWVDKAAALPDMADDEWTSMLCVETAVGLGGGVTLEPGEELMTGVGLSVRPLA